MNIVKTASAAWLQALEKTITHGVPASPRGKKVNELFAQTHQIDMRYPVITVPARKLNYKFMAAEAYWMLEGDDKVATIAPFNPNIAQFSDDGETFFGAYGPKIREQLPYVLHKLREDPDSRQAGLTIWRPSPPQTKDVPCTVAMFFTIRDSLLHANVFMRSNDLWLGFPYDVFNFSMVAHLVCTLLNTGINDAQVAPGTLYLTAANSHLYQPHWGSASEIVLSESCILPTHPVPERMHRHSFFLMSRLAALRHTPPGDELRWWEVRDEAK